MDTSNSPRVWRASAGLDLSPADVYAVLAHLRHFYPDFEAWFWQKVVPGLADGTRKLCVETRGQAIVGVSIAKLNADERKLCTLWVAESARGTGLGERLLRDACKWLGTDTPYATVPAERMDEVVQLFGKPGFQKSEAGEGLYRPGKKEFTFNGRVPS